MDSLTFILREVTNNSGEKKTGLVIGITKETITHVEPSQYKHNVRFKGLYPLKESNFSISHD